jgi:hypothetical protein
MEWIIYGDYQIEDFIQQPIHIQQEQEPLIIVD